LSPGWTQTPPRHALKASPNFNHPALFDIAFPERRFDAQDCGRYRQLENGIKELLVEKLRPSKDLPSADPGLDEDYDDSEFVQIQVTARRFDSGTRRIKQMWS
jgi:hypothetical protein